MGSVEVYDYKRREWIPYVADSEKWYQHLKDLRDGHVRPDYMGRYIVGSGAKQRRMTETEHKPVVQLVTPVAQAVEIAKSELTREKARNNVTDVGKPSRQRKKRRVKRISNTTKGSKPSATPGLKKKNPNKKKRRNASKGRQTPARKREIERETNFDVTPNRRKRYRYDVDAQV